MRLDDAGRQGRLGERSLGARLRDPPHEGTATVEKVTFDESVVGTFVREAPKVAISVVSAKDAPIAQGAIKLTIKGDAAQVTVKKVNCVGGKAQPLPTATISLN